MDPSVSLPVERHLGLDLHQPDLVIGGGNARPEVVLSPRRIALDDWPKWAQAHLKLTAVVVLEATPHAWDC